jgi:ribosomal protein S18 acetylase RimI-like enzyme
MTRASGERDTALPDRLQRVSNAFMLDWLAKKDGVELVRIGGAVAALWRSEPSLDFVNRVYGVPRSLDEALARYRAAGLRPWFELPPGSEELERELERAGAERLADHAVLAGPAEAPEPELDVREGDPELFARTFVRAVGAPDEARASIERWNARLYVAYVDGEPAGAGALTIDGTLGHLTNAATIPALRGRGAQTALIRRRIRDAAAAGCSSISTGTSDPSSRRNLERAGLGEVYRNSAWRGPE